MASSPKHKQIRLVCDAAASADIPRLRGVLTEFPSVLNEHDNSDDRLAPLHHAASAGMREAVELLLTLGADPNIRSGLRETDTDAPGVEDWQPGWTPLLFAARHGHLACVRALLSYGANPSTADHVDITALHASAIGGHADIAHLLVSAGVPLDVYSCARHFDDTLGWFFTGTPVHCAAANGHKPIVQLLLDAGARPNLVNDCSGYTPAGMAAAYGHHEIAVMLIDAAAKYPDCDDSSSS